ncbi:MAG: hypothetical protein BWY84_00564 [Candidatus Aerophobetes bacterium ADurb.Bin490]|nr:MAG: hypothetical protein BWY84_00564 [Candidatus Aerophobetes bacterium ADurb.Bin490]
MDKVFELCAEHDIYIQLCLAAYGEFSDDINPGWAGNPYNSRNDGILDSQQEFFTSKLARDFFKNRLRYIAARWGYSRNLFAWEVFSEPDMVPGYTAAAVTEWHKDIFSYVKKYDKNKHPVSASFSDSEKGAAVWQLEEADFTQTHIYNLKDAAEELYNLSRIKTEKFNKPHIVSEFGTATAMEEMDEAKDEKGVQLHTAIWGGALSLSMGWPMIWWWDVYVDRYGLWDIYRPLSDFLRGVNWARGDYFLLRSEKAYYYDAENKPAGSVKIYPDDRQVKAKKNRFVITPAGDVINREYFIAYLYGKAQPDKKNDPVFVMTNRFPAKLIIGVSRVSGSCALAVEVNGERVFLADIDAKTLPDAAPEKGADIYSADCALSYTVDLHAGDNEVALINAGSGRIKLDYLEVTDFTDPLIAPAFLSGIQSEAAAYIWYKHKNYTWENTPADKVEGAYFDVPDLRPGRYVIEFFDTYTGEITGKKQAIKHEEDLRIDLPEFYTDGAIKIKEYK